MRSAPPLRRRSWPAGEAPRAEADSLRSRQLDLSGFDDPFPFFDLGEDEAAHFFRAARARRAAPLGEALRDLRERNDAPHLAVDPLDDRLRQSRRACDT